MKSALTEQNVKALFAAFKSSECPPTVFITDPKLAAKARKAGATLKRVGAVWQLIPNP